MKTKLLSLLIALIGLITLSSCEATTKTMSAPINFSVVADCDAAGIKKIEALFKDKGLPIGNNITMSVVVDQDVTTEEGFKVLEDKIKNTLLKSSTSITPAEFYALSTDATYVTYSAYHSMGDRNIGTVTTEFVLE